MQKREGQESKRVKKKGRERRQDEKVTALIEVSAHRRENQSGKMERVKEISLESLDLHLSIV